MDGYGNFERAVEVWLKPAVLSDDLLIIFAKVLRNILEFSVAVPHKWLTLLRDIDPEAAMSAYRRCALNCKPDSNWCTGFWCEINVVSRNIGRAIVVEWKEINLIGGHSARSHVVSWGDVRAGRKRYENEESRIEEYLRNREEKQKKNEEMEKGDGIEVKKKGERKRVLFLWLLYNF